MWFSRQYVKHELLRSATVLHYIIWNVFRCRFIAWDGVNAFYVKIVFNLSSRQVPGSLGQTGHQPLAQQLPGHAPQSHQYVLAGYPANVSWTILTSCFHTLNKTVIFLYTKLRVT